MGATDLASDKDVICEGCGGINFVGGASSFDAAVGSRVTVILGSCCAALACCVNVGGCSRGLKLLEMAKFPAKEWVPVCVRGILMSAYMAPPMSCQRLQNM